MNVLVVEDDDDSTIVVQRLRATVIKILQAALITTYEKPINLQD